MNNFEKIDFIKTVFIGSVKTQLQQQWTWGAAALIGLHQGLKYKGSFKTGIIAGAATLIVISGANGAYNIATNWDKMKEIFKKDEKEI